MSGFRGNSLKAIRLADAKGDITGTPAVAWTLDRDTPYVPSPLLYDGILYFLKTNNGLLSAFDAKTGKPHYQRAAARGGAERVRVAGRRRGPRLHRRTRGQDARDQARAELEVARGQRARRRLRRVAGARRQRDLPARIQVLYCIAGIDY